MDGNLDKLMTWLNVINSRKSEEGLNDMHEAEPDSICCEWMGHDLINATNLIHIKTISHYNHGKLFNSNLRKFNQKPKLQKAHSTWKLTASQSDKIHKHISFHFNFTLSAFYLPFLILLPWFVLNFHFIFLSTWFTFLPS